MRYEGPIYRPPSEANSLLIQVTVGCPHNKCTFCMVYKNGPKYKVRPVDEVIDDLKAASLEYKNLVRTIFFPAGNTIAAPTHDLEKIFNTTRELFPKIKRMTVYGSSKYILKKGESDLKRLADSGLSRIHIGLESGDESTLADIKKGCTRDEQIKAGLMLKKAKIENSSYVMLGIAGRERSEQHALATTLTLNEINPEYIRLRTFVPKVNTPILRQVQKGNFCMLGPHGVLQEAKTILRNLRVSSKLESDHYTNYINLNGKLPEDKGKMLQDLDNALKLDESYFRPFFIGTE